VITLTENATVKVKELIAQEGQDGLMLRVAVRPGGCSGFSYEMFFDSETDGEDLVDQQGGVAVVVDPSSAQLLTVCRVPGSPSTTRTRRRPAVAVSRSADPGGRLPHLAHLGVPRHHER
jgi:iron-sulfur cluster assembly accessory protein